MTRTYRIDFEAGSGKPEFVPVGNGSYKAKCRINSIGVYDYGEQKELRSIEEVRKGADSFKGVPLKLNHASAYNPNDGKIIGKIGEDVSFDGVYTTATVYIDSAEGIAAYRNGKQSFSCEYTCDVEEKAGRFLGAEYTHIQTNIKGKGVALVDSARGGETLTAIKADAMPRPMGRLEVIGERVIYRAGQW